MPVSAIKCPTWDNSQKQGEQRPSELCKVRLFLKESILLYTRWGYCIYIYTLECELKARGEGYILVD